MSDLNTRLIGNLSLLGMIPGIVEVSGFHPDFVWIFWLAFWIFVSAVVTRRIKQKQFIHSALIGAFAYMISAGVKMLGLDIGSGSFISYSPQIPEGTNPRIYIASIGILVAVINALVTGFFQLSYKKFTAKKV